MLSWLNIMPLRLHQSIIIFFKFLLGLGMYETPLFLAHEEESGGRSVPTTPLQVAAPGELSFYR